MSGRIRGTNARRGGITVAVLCVTFEERLWALAEQLDQLLDECHREADRIIDSRERQGFRRLGTGLSAAACAIDTWARMEEDRP